MKDKLKIGLSGHIVIRSISSNKSKILLNTHNEVESTALEIVTRCLSQVDFNKAIDKVKVYGNFPAKENDVFFVKYDQSDNSMLFRALFTEGDFSGNITKLELRCSALDKTFSNKSLVNITKDDQTRIQVDWKIIITN